MDLPLDVMVIDMDWHLEDKYAVIDMSHTTSGKVKTIKVVRESGMFDGYEAARSLEIRLEASVPPETILINGEKLKSVYRPEEHGDCWSYDGRTAAVVIKISEFNLDDGIVLTVKYPENADPGDANGLRGCFNRLSRVNDLVVQLTSCRVLHPEERLAQEVSHAAVRMAMRPDSFSDEMQKLKNDLERLPGIITEVASASLGSRYDLSMPPRFKICTLAIAILNDIELD